MTFSDDSNRGFGRRRDGHRVTFVHGDRVRSIHIDTGWLTAAAVVVGVFALAWGGTAGWLMFRDDVLAGPLARQLRVERAYEDRVAGLRAEIDRINGRQLIDQEAFEAKIDQLAERQRRLDETQTRIGTLIGKAGDAGLSVPSAATVAPIPSSIPMPRPAVPVESPAKAPVGGLSPIGQSSPDPRLDAAEPSRAPSPGPAPLDVDKFATPLRSSWLPGLVSPANAARDRLDPARTIAAVEKHIEIFEKQQRGLLGGLVDVAEKRERAYSRVLGRLGYRVAASEQRPRPRPNADGVGGPFVPLASVDALERADEAIGRLQRYTQVAAALPLARPLPGNPAVTSGFGSRLDPFIGVPAMHTGLDFRADTGDAVHVTAPGTVISAGRQGGYGLCVDVDHGGGVVTRYGHLSSIGVSLGDRVKTGTVIARAGNTGRSTAPHLHYETRVAGEAVDPRDWLDAGRELGL